MTSSRRSRVEHYEQAVTKEIGGGARIYNDNGRNVLHLTCDGGLGGVTHATTFSMGRAHQPPDNLRGMMVRHGWRIGRRPTCPACIELEKGRKRSMSTAPAAAITPETRPEPTPGAKAIHRAVMEALMSVYDDDKKGYDAGYSDDKVSEETGAAIEYVRKCREDYFGPIAPPSEFEAFRSALGSAEQSIAQMEGRHAREIEAARNDISKLGDNLRAAATKNGWKL